MSITERTKNTVESWIEDLKNRYDEFDVLEKTWEHSADMHRAIIEKYNHGSFGGAGVWVTNDDGEVLLVRNEGDDGWGDPGGKREEGESFEEAARREVLEETGIECDLTEVREVHMLKHRSSDPDLPTICDAIVIFDGEYRGGTPRPRQGEIAEIDWFSTPPSNVLYEEVATRPYPASN